MYRWILTLTVGVVLLSASVANAEPFNNPPETDPLVPPGGWLGDLPYQRNALIDFATDPYTWSNGLEPGINYDLEGDLDPGLYPSDSFDWTDEPWWVDTIPQFPHRQGFFGIYDSENRDIYITWHMDNWPEPRPLKHIWLELEFLIYGSADFEGGVFPEAGSIVTGSDDRIEVLPDYWIRYNAWVEVQPNPPWEDLVMHMWTAPTTPGTMLLDYAHVATECVPEPSSFALAAAALACLGVMVARRRRGR